MTGKITEAEFLKIKDFLNTKILVDPPISYVAETFGRSSGTISQINRSATYAQYKSRYATGRSRIESDMYANNLDIAKAKKSYEDFNNEWFFGGEE